jgi:transcriptional regulator with XRE-family HTH domain
MRKSPSASGKAAALIDARIAQLQGHRSQKEIARNARIAPNALSQMRHGTMKVPLDRAAVLADALEIPRARLVRFAMEDGLSAEALDAIYSVAFPVSDNERELVEFVRNASGDTDPTLTDTLCQAIRSALA